MSHKSSKSSAALQAQRLTVDGRRKTFRDFPAHLHKHDEPHNYPDHPAPGDLKAPADRLYIPRTNIKDRPDSADAFLKSTRAGPVMPLHPALVQSFVPSPAPGSYVVTPKWTSGVVGFSG